MARYSRKPVVKTFKLKTDPDGKAEVVIRQARNIDTERRGDLFADTTAIIEGRTTSALRQHWNIHEQRKVEAGLVIVSITGIEMAESDDLDAKVVPMFRTKDTPDGPRLDMSQSEFFEAWGQLSDEMVREIHSYVLVTNPHWNPNAVGE